MEQHERRLEVIRQFLLDLELHSGTLLESKESLSYLRWNLDAYLKERFERLDRDRKVRRIAKSQKEFWGHELPSVDSPSQSLTIGHMGKHISEPEALERWIFLKLLSPILAEENRYLDRSEPREIWTVGGICGTASLSSNRIIFKAWEAVLFPNAKDVPPRFEPSPDELQAPARKLE